VGLGEGVQRFRVAFQGVWGGLHEGLGGYSRCPGWLFSELLVVHENMASKGGSVSFFLSSSFFSFLSSFIHIVLVVFHCLEGFRV
jgi:hypothetical protein